MSASVSSLFDFDAPSEFSDLHNLSVSDETFKSFDDWFLRASITATKAPQRTKVHSTQHILGDPFPVTTVSHSDRNNHPMRNSSDEASLKLEALLAKHNQKFNTKKTETHRKKQPKRPKLKSSRCIEKATTKTQKHSVKDVRQWEAINGLKYCELDLDARAAANREIDAMKRNIL